MLNLLEFSLRDAEKQVISVWVCGSLVENTKHHHHKTEISHGRFFPYNAAIHSTLLLKPKTKLVLKVPDISQKLSAERELALKDI